MMWMIKLILILSILCKYNIAEDTGDPDTATAIEVKTFNPNSKLLEVCERIRKNRCKIINAVEKQKMMKTSKQRPKRSVEGKTKSTIIVFESSTRSTTLASMSEAENLPGRPCEVSEDCAFINNTQCLLGDDYLPTCQCKEEYDLVENACVLRILGMPCQDKVDCPGEMYKCKVVKCACAWGYELVGKACKSILDKPCKVNSDCSNGLYNTRCREDNRGSLTCQCTKPKKFHRIENVCGVGLNKTCTKNKDCAIEYSKCLANADGLMMCRCPLGDRDNGTHCNPTNSIGEDCESVDDCRGSNLGCINKICLCVDGFKESEGECIAYSNMFDKDCISTVDCKDESLVCESGKCKCTWGYKENNEMCNKVYGSRCTSKADCLGVGNFDCKKQPSTVEGALTRPRTCQCKKPFALIDNLLCGRRIMENCHQNSDCVAEFSECYMDSVCQCIKGYAAWDNLHCELSKTMLGHSCELREDCGEDSKLICSNLQCVCARGYEMIDHDCLTIIGKDCINPEDCAGVKNSVCQPSAVDQEASRTCECAQGAQLIQHLCGKDIGQDCSKTDDCVAENSQCFKIEETGAATCQCMPGYEIVNEDKTTCHPLGQIGQKCNTVKQCSVKNGVCFHDHARDLRICACGDGYYQVTLKDCAPVLGRSCDAESACSTLPFAHCLSPNGSRISITQNQSYFRRADELTEDANGKCECSDGYITDVDGIHCALGPAKLNETCRGNKECLLNSPNSKCQAIPDLGKRCVCILGFMPENEVCVQVLGKVCDFDSECMQPQAVCRMDPDNKSRKICQCTKLYERHETRCFSIYEPYLGKKCNNSQICKSIPFAECATVSEDGKPKSKECRCRESYIEVDYECISNVIMVMPLEIGSKNLIVYWTDPHDDLADHYEVQYLAPNMNKYAIAGWTDTNTKKQMDITDLVPNTSYLVCVKPILINDTTESYCSKPINLKTKANDNEYDDYEELNEQIWDMNIPTDTTSTAIDPNSTTTTTTTTTTVSPQLSRVIRSTHYAPNKRKYVFNYTSEVPYARFAIKAKSNALIGLFKKNINIFEIEFQENKENWTSINRNGFLSRRSVRGSYTNRFKSGLMLDPNKYQIYWLRWAKYWLALGTQKKLLLVHFEDSGKIPDTFQFRFGSSLGQSENQQPVTLLFYADHHGEFTKND